ncbi:MAG TPA: PDZ domain-containing protein, partial [Deltaproteobacteria bacterium]|nr:PDZ domain-containing protein [Deltaproteobacteria bacterium]
MITAAPRTKNRWTPRTGRFGGIDGNAIVLLGLICFLVLWSFWGDGVEEAIYDQTFPGYNAYGDVGVKISVSKAPGGQPIIEVLAVSSNSPAARAGLMPGDLIMGMNGRILSSTGIAWRYLDNMKAGETVQWTINRNGRNRSIHIHLNQGFGATGILRNKALMFRSLSATRQFVITLLFFKLSLILFYLLYRRLRNRTLIVALFAVKFVLIGSFLGVYNPLDAFFAIKFNTLSLLLGMSIITVVLNEAGFFKRVAG